MQVDHENGQKALTHFRVLDRAGQARGACWRCGRAPAGRISCACIARRSAVPSWATASMAARKRCWRPSPMPAACISMPAGSLLPHPSGKGELKVRPSRRLTSAVPLRHSASRSAAIERESGGMRIPWRRLAWVLAAAVPIAAIAGIVWVATRDLSRYQARLTEQIRKVTGRELAAQACRWPSSSAREPAMVAEGVTLSNAAWGSRPELARVRKLTLFLDPVSLFLGEIKIGRVVLEGADILVETQRGGRRQPRHAAAARRIGAASGREPFAPAAHEPGLSLDRHHRGARLGPDHRRRRGPSAGRAGGGERPPSSRRRPTSRCRSRAASPHPRPRRSTSRARPARSMAG